MMVDKTESQYDVCMDKIHELIDAWEKIRPDEELVIITLTKYDQTARQARLTEIGQILLREKWESNPE